MFEMNPKAFGIPPVAYNAFVEPDLDTIAYGTELCSIFRNNFCNSLWHPLNADPSY